MSEKFVLCIGPTRRSFRKQSNQLGDGAADDQRGRNTETARQVLPHSAEARDTEELRLHTLDAGETSDLCGNYAASRYLSVIRRSEFYVSVELAESWDWQHFCWTLVSVCKLSCVRTA